MKQRLMSLTASAVLLIVIVAVLPLNGLRAAGQWLLDFIGPFGVLLLLVLTVLLAADCLGNHWI